MKLRVRGRKQRKRRKYTGKGIARKRERKADTPQKGKSHITGELICIYA